MINIIISILIGALAGFIAGYIMKSKGGLLRNAILGIVGGLVGELLFRLIGVSFNGYLGTIIVSVIGSCLLLFIFNKLFK